jgi:hypothetical protein
VKNQKGLQKMSFNINFADQGMGLILKRTTGSASGKAIAKSLVAFLHENKEALQDIRYMYVDYTETAKLKTPMEDIIQFVEIAKTVILKNNKLVVATCAPQFENYCLTKLWEVHLPEDLGWIIMGFRYETKAKEWLIKTVQQNLTFV